MLDRNVNERLRIGAQRLCPLEELAVRPREVPIDFSYTPSEAHPSRSWERREIVRNDALYLRIVIGIRLVIEEINPDSIATQ